MNQKELFKVVLQEFAVEATEQLDEIEQLLLRLEREPSHREPLADIFRILHTLKGNAQSISFGGISELAHACEDLLAALRAERVALTAGAVKLLFSAAEALKRWVTASVEAGRQTGEEEYHQALLASLREAAQREMLTDFAGVALPEGPVAKTSTVRVDIGKLDRLLDITGEITISRGRIQQLLKDGRLTDALEAHREADRLFLDLQEQVMRMRMIPIAPLFRQFDKTVRDLAVETNKPVDFYAEGEEVELDARALEMLRGPLTHIIRNAVDHGIESPDERVQSRKSPKGRIKIKASHDTGGIVIEVTDDGRGFDLGAIRAKAREQGLAGETASLSDDELLQFVFLPGFSTADSVTQLSGRGVGMDVVKSAVESLRGSIHIESAQGSGSKCVIRLPLTLAILDCFAVEAGGETYLIALDALVECNDFAGEQVHEGFAVISYREGPLPCILLNDLFRLPPVARARQSVVVIRWKNHSFGLIVDRLIGDMQAVVKPLSPLLQGLNGLTGTTILGNGKVAFILDLSSMRQTAVEKYNLLFPEQTLNSVNANVSAL